MFLSRLGNKRWLTGVGALALVALLLFPSLALASGDRKIPDPEHFFSDFDVEVKSKTSSGRWLTISGGEESELLSAGIEYLELLTSSAYSFETTDVFSAVGSTRYTLCYEGKSTYKNPAGEQIIVYLNYGEGYAANITLHYSDCEYFSFVSEDEYSGTLYDLILISGYKAKKTATATPKVTKKATAKPTPKATKKATAKPTATPKATKKATTKPTATPKATKLSGTQVATGIDLSYLSNVSKYGVQDVRYWSKGTISFSKKPLDMDGYMIYWFKCSQSVLEEYIDDLCENGFTLVTKYEQSSSTYGKKFLEYALVCDDFSGATIKGLYSKVACHIDIWKDDSSWRMDVVDGLTYCDVGLRQRGFKQKVGEVGDSANSGLLYEKGTYSTDDGRFSAKVGKADVLVNGKSKTGTATLKKKSTKAYLLTVEGFGTGQLEFSWNKEKILDYGVYLHSDFEGEDVSLTLTLDGTEMTPKAKGKVHFSSLVLRVMHYDAEENGVFYLYARTFDGDTVEMLVAVNLAEVTRTTATPAVKASSDTETITVGEDTTIYIKAGQTVILKSKYNSSYDLGTMYTTYEWNLSGSSISLEGVYDKATIKGLKKGTSTITLKYCYTKDEPDVLTGITRHNAKARNRTYTIVVE